jgi:TPR repeat protein
MYFSLKAILLFFSFLFASNMAQAFVLAPPECRFGQMQICAVQGRLEYLVLYGTIQHSDYDDIKSVANVIPADKPFPTVYMQSLGGSLDAAYAIGRLFRKRAVTVRSGNPITGDKYSKCSSSCMLIAAGAVKRYLVHVGMHSPAVYGPNDEKKPFPEEDYAELERYLADMGMDPRVFLMIRSTHNDDILNLTYNPNRIGDSQYIVQFGFYQGVTSSEDTDAPSPIRYTHFLYDRASLVFAAMNGSRGALRRLVDEYTYGTPEIKQDLERARIWLEIGANQEDISSLHNLGVLHVQQNHDALAVPYFKRAAVLGFSGSQNNYGWHLYKGEGIKRNKAEALYWIVRSAEQGEPFAYCSLCEIYSAGDVLSPDPIEAMKWCRLAADQMPLGKARDTAVKIMDRFARRMNEADVKEANLRVDTWQPLRQTSHLLRDKDEKSAPVFRRYF